MNEKKLKRFVKIFLFRPEDDKSKDCLFLIHRFYTNNKTWHVNGHNHIIFSYHHVHHANHPTTKNSKNRHIIPCHSPELHNNVLRPNWLRQAILDKGCPLYRPPRILSLRVIPKRQKIRPVQPAVDDTHAHWPLPSPKRKAYEPARHRRRHSSVGCSRGRTCAAPLRRRTFTWCGALLGGAWSVSRRRAPVPIGRAGPRDPPDALSRVVLAHHVQWRAWSLHRCMISVTQW